MLAHPRSVVAFAIMLVTALNISPALGADPSPFCVLNFKPAASTRSHLVTESGLPLSHLQFAGGLMVNYAHRPLDVINLHTKERVAEAIRYQVNMDLLLAVGLFDRLELGLALPMTLAQDAASLDAFSPALDRELSGGVGDVRIIPKLRIHTKQPVTFAVAAPFSLPSGKEEQYLGDAGVTWSPRVIFSLDSDEVSLALNLGYRVRADQSFTFSRSQTLTLDDEVFGSLGVKLGLWPRRMDLLIDGFFSTAIKEQDMEEIPVEVLGGFRLYLPHGIICTLGGGGGASRGIGTPRFRILGGLAYQMPGAPPAEDQDPDRDGILGKQDGCPHDPEDKDGFQDADGCPELDNDSDGILDRSDRCPNEPEDRDGFQDADGCPDPDNDNDGFEDTRDRCPVRPEDRDGFDETDGCPDPDNDMDRIPDTDDSCPNEPEDKDGFEDTDGCPDPDNDMDRILDRDDRCPNQAEVYNGVEDTDGCPDRSRGPVRIERGKITVPPVYFATAKDIILRRSYPVLLLVAETLKKNPWVRRVRIEGHTDSRGGEAFNLDLSARRAHSVRRFLIANGVNPDRLESEGFGESQPIATNLSRRGRALNRRVEFVIIDPPFAPRPAAPRPAAPRPAAP